MKKTAIAVLTAAIFAFLGMTAAAEESAAATQAVQTDQAAATTTAPEGSEAAEAAPAPDPDAAVATVNGDAISVRLLTKVLQQVNTMPGSQKPTDMKKEVLDKIVDLELISQQAEKAGLDKDPDFVIGMDMYKKQQLFAAYLNKEIVEKVKVTPEEVQAEYDANKDSYVAEEQVTASHILVDTEEEAKKIKERLDAGESFEDIAKAESKCPSSSRGGDLGSFGKGAMVPEFEQAAFALNPGEVSGPVKTQFGWHIIKVREKKPGGVKPFDEVKAEIEQKMLQDKQQKAYEELLANLRKSSAISVNSTLLESVQ